MTLEEMKVDSGRFCCSVAKSVVEAGLVAYMLF